MNRYRRVMWAVVFLVLIGMLMCVMDARAEEVNMDIVIQIESGGNPNAYNKDSGAIGLCQITPVVLKEWNKSGQIPFLERGLYKPEVNRPIGDWYMNTRIPQMLKAYKIPDTIDNRLISYNAGIKVCKDYHRGKIKRLPRETVNYLKKYHKLEKGG